MWNRSLVHSAAVQRHGKGSPFGSVAASLDQAARTGRTAGGMGEVEMRRALLKLRHDDEGLSTAEYAVGTVAVAGLGGLLVKLLTSEWIYAILQRIIERAFSLIFG